MTWKEFGLSLFYNDCYMYCKSTCAIDCLREQSKIIYSRYIICNNMYLLKSDINNNYISRHFFASMRWAGSVPRDLGHCSEMSMALKASWGVIECMDLPGYGVSG